VARSSEFRLWFRGYVLRFIIAGLRLRVEDWVMGQRLLAQGFEYKVMGLLVKALAPRFGDERTRLTIWRRLWAKDK
jgi:hypothetical protein